MSNSNTLSLLQTWSIDIVIGATILLALVLVVDSILKRFGQQLWRSSVWNACWVAVLMLPIAIMCTPKLKQENQLAFGSSIANWMELDSGTIDENAAIDDEPVTRASETKTEEVSALGPTTSAAQSNKSKSSEMPVSLFDFSLSTALWFAVLVVCAGGVTWKVCRNCVGIFQTRKLSASAAPLLDSTWLNNVNDVCNRLGLPVVPCKISDGISVPIVVGIFTPVILIPSSLVGELSASESKAVLIHEMAHIKRRDPIWNIVQLLAGSVFWFHPLVVFGRRRYLESRELACDDFCVGALDGPQEYGETLIKIAARQFTGPLESSIAFARDSKIASRIQFISHSEGNMFCCSSKFQNIAALGLVAVLVMSTAGFSIQSSAYGFLTEPKMVFEETRLVQVISDNDYHGMNCMDLSPDGEFLYASAWRTSTIHVYRVTGFEGQLEKIQTFRHENLKNNSSVRISPDGKWAVSGTGFGQAVVLMHRDGVTGELTYADHHDASSKTTGDRYFNDAVFSPNSKLVAVASTRSRQGESGSLSLFSVGDGKLQWHQTEQGDDGQFSDPRSIAFSKDGKTIVCSALKSHSLVVLDCDLETPRISIRQVVKNGKSNVTCLGKAFGARFGPEERFVYTTGGRTVPQRRSDDAPMGVGVFQFDDNNQLRVVQQITDASEGCEGLGGGNELEVSPDGKYVVTTLTDSHSVAVFQRDRSTGQLDLADVIQVPSDENFSPAGLAIGNDSRTIIVSSEDSKKLYRFQIVEKPKQ